MARRSPKDNGTPLNAKQQELARRESQLRDQMQKLERMIQEAPIVAQERTRQQREEILSRATEGGSRLDVSIALNDKRYGDGGRHGGGRRVALRKERREGRIIFLVLVIALAAAVLWLVSNLRF
jgi:TolA-binding protein